jgi:hypothetical protein
MQRKNSGARAALLAAAMNFTPVEPLDFLRFLRVPAIHFVLRHRHRARTCREKTHRPRRRA